VASEVDTGRAGERADERIRTLSQRVDELGRSLLEADARLSRIGELELELREQAVVEQELRAQRDEAQALLARARDVHDQMVTSLSWRLTRPLRALKARRGS
jgi:chromosome segregation ATPase